MAVKSWTVRMALIGFVSVAWGADTVPALPVSINATDANIRYIGRFDCRDPAGPRCAWSNSSVRLKFMGTALNVKLADTNENQWQVIVDGKPGPVIKSKGRGAIYPLANGLAEGEHAIELVKRTEAFNGTTQFQEFQISAGGKLLPVPAARRRLEIIGDSITCGYGNEGKSEQEHFSPNTENGYSTYGAIAARELGAEYMCIAWSGKKMWPDNTIPALYDLTLPQDSMSQWDFSKWTPDVVVINLATNDFGKKIPDENGWTTAYEGFSGARPQELSERRNLYRCRFDDGRLGPDQATDDAQEVPGQDRREPKSCRRYKSPRNRFRSTRS